jgi:hypothetical protein
MSYGISLAGDNSSLLINSESQSLTFLGKPTFVSRQGITGSGYGPLYFTTFGVTLYNWPQCSVYNYTFNAGTNNVIYFVYSPHPYKSSVISVQKSGSTDTISIVSQPAGSTSFIPTLYAFTASVVPQTTGYGFNVFKSNGSCAFSTQENILFANKIYSFTGQASNLQATSAVGGLTYAGNGPSSGSATISYITPSASDGVAITKPIVYFPAPQTAVFRSSGSQRFFYELCASYNPSTFNLEIEWINGFFESILSSINYNVPSLPGFAMVADGALYD